MSSTLADASAIATSLSSSSSDLFTTLTCGYLGFDDVRTERPHSSGVRPLS